MPYVKIISDYQLDIYPESPEMGGQFYSDLGYEFWTIDQINQYRNEHQPPFNARDYVYSQLEVKKNLSAIGLWQEIKQLLITNDLWDDFIIADGLSFSESTFEQTYNALKATYPNIDIDEILKNCIKVG